MTMNEDLPNNCSDCRGSGLRPCDHAGTGRDELDWCTTCDQPTDEAGSTTCHCQPE